MFYDNLSNEVEHYKTEYLGRFTTEEYNIIVCIENYDDEPFWKFIFDEILGVKPFFHNFDENNLLLYIEGHIIFDSILNLLEKFQNNNVNLKIQSIGSSSEYTGAEKNNKINELKNKKFDIETALRINYNNCFYNQTCPSLNQIILDIKNSLDG
jgi:hypothetical protein